MRKTVISSSAIIHDENNNVLLAKRSSNKSLDPGCWETIGCTVEKGENFEECLQREIREEIQCEINSLKLFQVYTYKTKNTILISNVYIVTLSGTPIPEPLEIEELRWFSKREIDPIKFAVDCETRIRDYFNFIEGKCICDDILK